MIIAKSNGASLELMTKNESAGATNGHRKLNTPIRLSAAIDSAEDRPKGTACTRPALLLMRERFAQP